MRRLTGGVPRGFRDGRSREARAYRAYVLSTAGRFGWTDIPAGARTLLREAGRIVVELERLGFALDAARTVRDRNRAYRQQRVLRTQLLGFESRLEQLATTHGRAVSPADYLRSFKGKPA